jgi:class 3 adenylate cyclase/tetratricopeptide (TPR) repeat protein
MFADVANFTSLSERLDPEEVHRIMDGCFRILLDETHRYEGTINQFTGDGVMALFGAPVAHEDHARRGCHASLAIQKALVPYGEELKRRYGAEFKMRIGVNSGPVIVGAIGDDLRMDYTAVGDTTNLASRMEHLALPGSVIISGNTHRLVRDFFDFRPLGRVKIKGKEEPQEAFELIREGDLATRIAAAAARGLTPFVGREDVLKEMVDAYRQVCSGSGLAIEIVGEAGVGKSRLLLEFRQRLPKDEFSYLEGCCTRFGHSTAYLPIRHIVRSCLGAGETEPDEIRWNRLAAPLQDLLGIKIDDPAWMKLEPKERRDRTFEAIRDLLIGKSRERPLIITVEDVHWIDRSSEEFLLHFMRWLENARILLFFLRRPENTPGWSGGAVFKRIDIGQLAAGDSGDLLKAALSGFEAAPEVREIVCNRAGGNPLFLEELTRTLLENRSIQKIGGAYELTGASSLQVPDTVQGIIAARLDRLEERPKETLQTASAIGREFALGVLQRISHGQDLTPCLVQLQGLDFIHEKGVLPEPEYAFKHALTQEVCYNSMLLGRRREIHNLIARAIEEIYPKRLEEFYEVLAGHYSKGGGREKAIHYLRLSAEKSLRNNSLWVALGLYKELLLLLDRGPETDECKREKVGVLVSMIPILRGLGFPEDPADILQEGARLCEEVQDKRSMAMIRSYAAMSFTFRGDAALGSNYLERSYLEAEREEDLETLGPLVFGLMPSYVQQGKFRKVVDASLRIRHLYEKTHPRSGELGMPAELSFALLLYGGLSLGFLGDFERGEEECRKAISMAQDMGQAFSIGAAELSYGSLLTLRSRGDRAIEHLRKSIEHYEKSQGTIWQPMAWSYLGVSYGLLGNIPKALECLETGLRMQVESGLPALLSLHQCHLSAAHLELGDYPRAISHAREAARLAEGSEEHYEALSLIYLGVAEWRSGMAGLAEARARLEHAILRIHELGLKPWEAQAHLHLGMLLADAGEKEEGLQRVRTAEVLFVDMGMDRWVERARVKGLSEP